MYISFVSGAYPGSISDVAITQQSGLLDRLDEGDAIMADKGFTLKAADLQTRGLKLVLPPFKEGDRQMPVHLVAKNQKVANKELFKSKIRSCRDHSIKSNFFSFSIRQM